MSQCQLSPSGPCDHLSCSDGNAMQCLAVVITNIIILDLSKDYCFVLEED